MKDYAVCNSIYEKIGKVEKVLDIGCGEGYLVNCLAKQINRKVLGFDISNQGFIRAHEKCKEFGTCALIGCMKGDAHNLTEYFPDDYFDAVILIYAFHHIEKPEVALGEIRRVLKNGGKTLIGDLWFTERKKKRDCFRFTVKDIQELLKMSKFKYPGQDRMRKDFVIMVGEK